MSMPSETKFRDWPLRERVVGVVLLGAMWFSVATIALMVLITLITGNDPTAP